MKKHLDFWDIYLIAIILVEIIFLAFVVILIISIK